MSGSFFVSSFAQVDTNEQSGQTTLSGDLLNNPLAQDILEKIEQTRQWIADLEEREYEKTKAQEELEERRAIALERLNLDLIEWEILWANYTSRAAFERFVDDKPAPIQGIFWDQFEFKEMKVNAGRTALKEVIANGGSLTEAREAYHTAAETKRIELIEMNAQFNVKHNLAYYKEQLLFNSTGQLTLNPFTQSQLNTFYSDYRSDPQYLLRNPGDKYAAESMETSPETKCREGYIVVHRLQYDDFTCVIESTAEMWERHGMGIIVDASEIFDQHSLSPRVKTNPGTMCVDGYIVVYHLKAREYGCVLEYTAKELIKDGIGEIHELTQFILDKDQQKEVDNKVFEINQEIDIMYDEQALDQIQLKKVYDQLYKDQDVIKKQEEKDLSLEFNSSGNMTKVDFSNQIKEIRKNHEIMKEQILENKSQALEDIEVEFHEKMQQMANEYETNSEIKIIWDSDTSKFQAISR
jgi:hypothetical protein